MPSWPTSNGWPSSRNWPTNNAWPSQYNWPSDFNGNIASLFPGAYQVLQSDRGLTYGGTMLPNAGNTSTATMALTGSLATAPVPIWIKLNIGGLSADIYYDGLGVTPAMTGVSISAGVPLALTGAGTGLSITPSVGTLILNDVWKATAAALADQSGNGNDQAQATATRQPVIGIGLNGKVELIGDGVDDYLTNATFQPPAGSMLWMVYRRITNSGFFQYLTDSGTADRRALYITGASTEAYNGASLAGGTLALGANGRSWVIFGGASSSIKIGSNAVVNGSTGLSVGVAGRTIYCAGNLGATTFTNMSLFALVWAPPGPTAVADAAINTSAGYGAGSITV